MWWGPAPLLMKVRLNIIKCWPCSISLCETRCARLHSGGGHHESQRGQGVGERPEALRVRWPCRRTAGRSFPVWNKCCQVEEKILVEELQGNSPQPVFTVNHPPHPQGSDRAPKCWTCVSLAGELDFPHVEIWTDAESRSLTTCPCSCSTTGDLCVLWPTSRSTQECPKSISDLCLFQPSTPGEPCTHTDRRGWNWRSVCVSLCE